MQINGIQLFKTGKGAVTQPSPLSQLLLSPDDIIVCEQNYHNTVQTAIAFSNKKQITLGSVSCYPYVRDITLKKNKKERKEHEESRLKASTHFLLDLYIF